MSDPGCRELSHRGDRGSRETLRACTKEIPPWKGNSRARERPIDGIHNRGQGKGQPTYVTPPCDASGVGTAFVSGITRSARGILIGRRLRGDCGGGQAMELPRCGGHSAHCPHVPVNYLSFIHRLVLVDAAGLNAKAMRSTALHAGAPVAASVPHTHCQI
jgi:hypothetical protein